MIDIKPFILDVTFGDLEFFIEQFEVLETSPVRDFNGLYYKRKGSKMAIKYRKNEAEKKPYYKIKHTDLEGLFLLKYINLLQEKPWAEWQTKILHEQKTALVRHYQGFIK